MKWFERQWTEIRELFETIVQNYRERDVCGFDLIVAVPPARSLTPRAVSRQIDKDRRKR